MKSKIKQKEEELEKGCGKVFQRQGVSKCGQIIMKTLILCEKCQAKLQGFQEAKKLFIGEIRKLKVYSVEDKKGNIRDCILIEDLKEKISLKTREEKA